MQVKSVNSCSPTHQYPAYKCRIMTILSMSRGKSDYLFAGLWWFFLIPPSTWPIYPKPKSTPSGWHKKTSCSRSSRESTAKSMERCPNKERGEKSRYPALLLRGTSGSYWKLIRAENIKDFLCPSQIDRTGKVPKYKKELIFQLKISIKKNKSLFNKALRMLMQKNRQDHFSMKYS